MYIEDIPREIPTPNPSGSNETAEEEEEAEEKEAKETKENTKPPLCSPCPQASAAQRVVKHP